MTASASRTRRSVLRFGALAAAAAVGAPGLARAARPARAATKIQLVVSIPYQGAADFQGETQTLIDEYIARNWTAHHPGVSVSTVAGMGCNGNCVTAGQEVAASLAGQPADIITGSSIELPQYLGANMLLPLDPYLRLDNVNMSDFSPGHLAALQTAQGQMALPEYDDPEVMLVNEGMLDDLGLPYPEPNWTYTQAERLWRSLTGIKNGKQIYGTGMDLLAWELEDVPPWLIIAFEGQKMNAAHTRSLLNSPQAFTAVNWMAPLVWDNVVTTNSGNGLITAGQAAFSTSSGGEVQSDAEALRSYKWNYYAMPTYPYGKPAGRINNDFIGINQYSKNARDLLWDMFSFIALDRGFALLQYKLTFITPNRFSMWPDYIAVVRATAPVMQNINLEAKMDAVRYDWAEEFMRYDPEQVVAVESTIWQEILGRKIDVKEGLDQAAQRINAIEATGPALQEAQQRSFADYQLYIRRAEAAAGAIAYPKPPVAGVGQASTPAGKLVVAGSPAGSYRLTAEGGGGVSGEYDNCIFAGQAFALSRGTFTCRLASLTAADWSKINAGAKIGLMARDTLAGSAASLGVEFAKDRGVHFHVRPLDGDPEFSDEKASSNTGFPGLLAQQAVQASAPKPGGNLLLKPLWFRLVLDIDHWTPYVSLDGSTWMQAEAPAPVEFVGAWVGVYASSHTGGQSVVAVFDHVSGFAPNTFVQIGEA